MAKLSNEELDEIVKQSLPGYRVSRRSQVAGQSLDAEKDSERAEPEHLRQLRRKYLGPDFTPDDDDPTQDSDRITFADGPVDDDESDDDIIVAVEPDTATDPLDRGSRAKAAVISKKEKKVIGQQG